MREEEIQIKEGIESMKAKEIFEEEDGEGG
jgi:hypothetical protein